MYEVTNLEEMDWGADATAEEVGAACAVVFFMALPIVIDVIALPVTLPRDLVVMK